jgi:ATP-binding cassette, subfamily B (MDR/TAP), member 1
VLKNASFFFPAGETTFVIGRSGSGKSTLGNLLMRFYAPESGDLLIDGNSIKTLDISWLRNNVTLVQQQSILFNETVFKNIAFGRRDHNKVRKEEVRRSSQTAYLQNTITELPLGLDTVVGTGGSAMSGGQRQRVAIARARLRDTPILILDEATSALDYISRTAVMDAIRKWRRGKTTIIVTHDMSQIQENEYAYVLDNGILVQEGFRQALEKADTGPFERAQPGPFERATSSANNFPVTTKEAQIRKSVSPDDEPSPRASRSSMDPMDIHFHPRRRFIPSVFGPSPEDLKFRRPSQGLISPLSPAAFSLHRMSVTPSTFTQTRRRTMPETDIFNHFLSVQLRSVDKADPEPSDPKIHMSPSRKSDFTPRQSRRRDSRISMTALKHKSLMPTRRRKLTKDEKARRIAPAKKILMTVWPTLQWRMRITLICGFLCAAIHAGGTQAFSWVFSKLLATFFLPSNRSQMALKWSLSVLGVAIVDAIASYSMHYLLESCGQAWIDSLRIQAMRRILDQPRAWFDRDKNNLTKLTECLDRNAEEMRNLLGRFAGFGFVAITMMLMAIVWSLVLCWKLTLVGLASGPILYAVTRSFEAVSGKWESKSNDAGENASAIFTETFVNIRVVRALTLEGYFHKKYTKATNRAMSVGFKRSAYSGFFFGLSDSGIIFVTGRRSGTQLTWPLLIYVQH